MLKIAYMNINCILPLLHSEDLVNRHVLSYDEQLYCLHPPYTTSLYIIRLYVLCLFKQIFSVVSNFFKPIVFEAFSGVFL